MVHSTWDGRGLVSVPPEPALLKGEWSDAAGRSPSPLDSVTPTPTCLGTDAVREGPLRQAVVAAGGRAARRPPAHDREGGAGFSVLLEGRLARVRTGRLDKQEERYRSVFKRLGRSAANRGSRSRCNPAGSGTGCCGTGRAGPCCGSAVLCSV